MKWWTILRVWDTHSTYFLWRRLKKEKWMIYSTIVQNFVQNYRQFFVAGKMHDY